MKRPRIKTVGLAVALTIASALGIFYLQSQIARAKRQAGRRPGVNVTVSRDTTFLTEPLRKDGYVNYLMALNRRAAEGVTPQNNAAVLFWQAVGPSEVKTEMRSRYFRMLSMAPPPDHNDCFITLSDFLQKLERAHDPSLNRLPAGGHDSVFSQQDEAGRRPWLKEDFPLVAEWLAANEKPLALLIEATKRPRCYYPLLCGDNDEGCLLVSQLPHISPAREVSRALTARAMLRLKRGDVSQGWQDLLACHRLARLTDQGPNTIVEALCAIAIDGRANSGDKALLRCVSLAAGQAASMRQDLAKLPPLPNIIDKIDVAERFMFLDSVAALARGDIDMLSLSGKGGQSQAGAKPRVSAAWASLDWEVVLRMGNTWFDRFVAAGRQPMRSERLAALDKASRELDAPLKINRGWSSMAATALFSDRAEIIGKMMIALMMPAVKSIVQAEDRGSMDGELIQVGFALAAYRADHGSYPQQLGELSPRYLPRVPCDLFANGAALRYRRQPGGFLLYSLGPNGRDDGGRGREEGEKAGQDWDDLSIRVP